MREIEAYDYGRYDALMADPRTQRVFKAVDNLASKMGIDYDLIGGAAVYLHSKNPPQDYPDIDFLLYATVVDAREFIETLSEKPKFSFGRLEINDGAVFGMVKYDNLIQVDILTDLEEPKRHGRVRKLRGVSVEPVEYLIIEKMMRPRPADVRSALDLLAYMDYDKSLLSRLAREKRLTGEIQSLEHHARRMAAGRLSKEGIQNVVSRLSVLG